MKQFVKKDEAFTCINCGKEVSPLGYTTRDHCPHCLYSIHIDIMPGDRANPCKGILKPIGIEKFKDTYKIVYQCEKCHEEHKNIMANDDSLDEIINISKGIN